MKQKPRNIFILLIIIIFSFLHLQLIFAEPPTNKLRVKVTEVLSATELVIEMNFRPVIIRLTGIKPPLDFENYEKLYKKIKKRVLNKEVSILFDKLSAKETGIQSAYLFPDNDTNLNFELIKSGDAFYNNENCDYKKKIIVFQILAIVNKKGIWDNTPAIEYEINKKWGNYSFFIDFTKFPKNLLFDLLKKDMLASIGLVDTDRFEKNFRDKINSISYISSGTTISSDTTTSSDVKNDIKEITVIEGKFEKQNIPISEQNNHYKIDYKDTKPLSSNNKAQNHLIISSQELPNWIQEQINGQNQIFNTANKNANAKLKELSQNDYPLWFYLKTDTNLTEKLSSQTRQFIFKELSTIYGYLTEELALNIILTFNIDIEKDSDKIIRYVKDIIEITINNCKTYSNKEFLEILNKILASTSVELNNNKLIIKLNLY